MDRDPFLDKISGMQYNSKSFAGNPAFNCFLYPPVSGTWQRQLPMKEEALLFDGSPFLKFLFPRRWEFPGPDTEKTKRRTIWIKLTHDEYSKERCI